MKKANKTAFLILRVEQSFKSRVMDKASEMGETVSEFIRLALSKRL